MSRSSASLLPLLCLLVGCDRAPAPTPSTAALTYAELLSQPDDPCAQLFPTYDRAMEKNPEVVACLERRCDVWLAGLEPGRPEDQAELRRQCDRALGMDDRSRVLPCAASACGRLVADDPGVALAAASRVAAGRDRLHGSNLWREMGVYGALVASDEHLAEVLALARERNCGEQIELLRAIEPVMALRGQPSDASRTWAELVALLRHVEPPWDACGEMNERALTVADQLDHGATATLVVHLWVVSDPRSPLGEWMSKTLYEWLHKGTPFPGSAAVPLLDVCREPHDFWREMVCSRVTAERLGWAPSEGSDPVAGPWAPQPPIEVGPEPPWLREVPFTVSAGQGACAALEPLEQAGRGPEACRQHLAHDLGVPPTGPEDVSRRFCLDQLCVRAVRSDPELALDAIELLRSAPADQPSQDLFESTLMMAYAGSPEYLEGLFVGAGRRPCATLGVLLAHSKSVLNGPGWLRGPAGEAALALVQHAWRDCAEPAGTIHWVEEIAGLDASEALGRIEEGESYDPALRAAAYQRLEERGGAFGAANGHHFLTREEQRARMREACESAQVGSYFAGICSLLPAKEE